MSLDVLNPVSLKRLKGLGGFTYVDESEIDNVNFRESSFFQSQSLPTNWVQLSSPTYRRSHFAMEQYNGSLWILGGYINGGGPGIHLERYDIAGDYYELIPVTGQVPNGTAAFASGILNGEFYMAGGVHAGGTTNDTFKINLTTGVGTRLADSPRLQMQGCFHTNGNLYREGGNDGLWPPTVSNGTSYYNPVLNSWANVANGSRLHDQTLILLDDLIYSTGGVNEATGSYYNQHKAYNPVTNSWMSLQPLPYRVNDHCGVALNGKLMLFGGSSPDAAAHRSCISYDPNTDQWTEITTTPEGFSLGEAATYNSEPYVMSTASNLWKLTYNTIRKFAIERIY